MVEALGRAGVIVRGGTPLGGPGHIRVTYGTATENRRFLEALRARCSERCRSFAGRVARPPWYNTVAMEPARRTSIRTAPRPPVSCLCLFLVLAI